MNAGIIEKLREERFLLFFLATLAALSLTYAVAIRVVDPHGDFATALFPVVEFDARAEKMDLFQEYIEVAPPDGLILGSSRAMKLNPQTLQAALDRRFFNFAVENARAEDYLAIYRWVREKGVHPKSLIVGLDIEALHNDDTPEWRLARNDALIQALERGALPGADPLIPRAPLAAVMRPLRMYKSTFTITHLNDTVRSVRLSLQPQSLTLPMFEVEADGYVRFRRWEFERATGTFQFDHGMERCLYEHFRRFQDMTALSSRRTAYLRQLIQDAQADGGKVVVWLTTLHPIAERHLATHTPYAALLHATRRYLASLGKDLGVPTYDFSTPADGDGTAGGWYDCGHMDETNAERVAAILVEALR